MFINELDELNWMSVYVLYDVILMFVNDVVCDEDYPCYRILTLLVIGKMTRWWESKEVQSLLVIGIIDEDD